MKKYKVVLSERVKYQLAHLSKKHRQILEKAIAEVAKDPSKGKKMDLVQIKSWDNERCPTCHKMTELWLDRNSGEVYTDCGCVDVSWMTLKELENGRRRYAKKHKIKYDNVVELVE